jgi:hypothetical protein
MHKPIPNARPPVKGFVRVGRQFLVDATDLTDAEYRLLTYLHSFQFQTDSKPRPSRNLVAETLGWSVAKFKRVRAGLEAKKWIKRCSRPGRTNEFQLTRLIYDPGSKDEPPTRLTHEPTLGSPVSPEEEEGNKGRGGDSSRDLELSLIANSSSPPVTAFDRFWKAYPRKRGKKAALKAWKNLKPNQGLVEIILKAVEAAKANGWDDPQYIPHPATWLNRGQWEDEHEGKAKSGYKFDPKYCGR